MFTSETDTECIAHRIHYHLKTKPKLFDAVRATVAELEGAYALAVMSQADPDIIVLARCGCPVVVGLGENENFVASDVSALLPVTRRFMFLEEGDVAEIHKGSTRVVDKDGKTVHRPVKESELSADAAEKGPVRALHAQGNPRAAPRRGADARRAGRERQAAARPPSGRTQRRFSAGPRRCTSSPAARAITPARSPATSSSRCAGSHATWRSRASSAIATRSSRRTPCSSRFPSRAKRPTPWPRCAWRNRPVISPRWRSATCLRALSCGNRTW